MADLMSIVPSNGEDPLDSPFLESTLRFWEDSNPTFDFDPQTLVYDQLQQQHDSYKQQWVEPESEPVEFGNVDNAFHPSMENLLSWDINNMIGDGNGDHTGTQADEFLNMGQGTSNVNLVPLAVWPPTSVPFSCSFCQVLREIMHTNGLHTTKLEIHGRIGIVCHAILETLYTEDDLPSVKHQMIDFSNQSIESVKQFLMQYFLERKQAGFVILQDPLWTFYDALCAGFNYDRDPANEFVQPSNHSQSENAGVHQTNHNRADNGVNVGVGGFPRSSLAAQRERTGRLRLSDLADYFHLPIDVAAKKLEICPTVLKKICRRNGMPRWPYRKIKSIDRKISKLKESLTEKDAEGIVQAQAEIQRLNQERSELCMGAIR